MINILICSNNSSDQHIVSINDNDEIDHHLLDALIVTCNFLNPLYTFSLLDNNPLNFSPHNIVDLIDDTVYQISPIHGEQIIIENIIIPINKLFPLIDYTKPVYRTSSGIQMSAVSFDNCWLVSCNEPGLTGLVTWSCDEHGFCQHSNEPFIKN